jgi:hypothetical protein
LLTLRFGPCLQFPDTERLFSVGILLTLRGVSVGVLLTLRGCLSVGRIPTLTPAEIEQRVLGDGVLLAGADLLHHALGDQLLEDRVQLSAGQLRAAEDLRGLDAVPRRPRLVVGVLRQHDQEQLLPVRQRRGCVL